jgi:hypothetical protein
MNAIVSNADAAVDLSIIYLLILIVLGEGYKLCSSDYKTS